MSRGDHRALMVREMSDKGDKPDCQETDSRCMDCHDACTLRKGKYWIEGPAKNSGIAAIHLLNPALLGKPAQAIDFKSM